jgi:aminoglycoside phosphotransferase (APT) family kinase protein
MDVAALIQYINQRHGCAFSVVTRCAGGTRGAYELADASGRRAILKFGDALPWLSRLRQAETLGERLRAIGYPMPRTLFLDAAPSDVWYQVQEFVPGVPMTAPLTPADLELLLALNALQADQRRATDRVWPDWSRYMQDVIFASASGWTDLLQAHSPATRSLLAALHAVALPYADVALSTADIVHGDFLPGNVLVWDGRVSAVIDFAQIGYGTRAHDLTRVFVWRYNDIPAFPRQHLADHIAAIATPAERTICLVYAVIDVLAYMIEQHPEVVEAWVQTGWEVLGGLAPQSA